MVDKLQCGLQNGGINSFPSVSFYFYRYIYKLLLTDYSLLNYLNTEVDSWLPRSHTTIQTWTIRTYESEKLLIATAVQSALSKIHLTVDLWSSPNSLAILGVVAHYISDSGQLEHTVLALQEVAGKHSGKNQSAIIMEVIQDFGIASKIGYFVMDNATNNDTLVASLSASKLPL